MDARYRARSLIPAVVLVAAAVLPAGYDGSPARPGGACERWGSEDALAAHPVSTSLSPVAARHTEDRARADTARNGVDLGVSWNLRVGRDPAVVADGLERLFSGYDADWVALQEGCGYLPLIRHTARAHGYELCSPKAGSAQTLLLVRKHRRDADGSVLRMSDGWPRNSHVPRFAATCPVDGYRVTSVHVPQDKGSVRKVRRLHELRTLAGLLNDHGRSQQVVVGDFNNAPSDRGPSTSHWLARKILGYLAAPDYPTHAAHPGPIDHAVVRGLAVTVMRGPTYGSDHHLIVLRVHRPDRSRL